MQKGCSQWCKSARNKIFTVDNIYGSLAPSAGQNVRRRQKLKRAFNSHGVGIYCILLVYLKTFGLGE